MAAIWYYLHRRQLRRERIFRDRQNPLEMFEDTELQQKFIFRRHDIIELTREMEPLLLDRGEQGGVLPALLQVCTTLRFFATGKFQDDIAQLIGVCQATVSRTVKKVLDVFLILFPRYVGPPKEAEVQQQKLNYSEKAGFPNVFACIGNTHIQILKPRNNKFMFFNDNKSYSLNVQIVCDADLNVLDCVAKPGSYDGSEILCESAFYEAMEDKRVDGLVLGHDEYPTRDWLMTPYSDPESDEQFNFNIAHQTAYSSYDKCINVLTNTWQCLQGIRQEPMAACRIIYACCILHNKAMKLGILPQNEDPEEDIQSSQPETESDCIDTDEIARVIAGEKVRDYIANTYF